MYISDRSQAIIALAVCATIAISVVAIAKAYVRSIEARRQGLRSDSPDVQERMSRIEHAVDAIAIEVERMSEGQRFTTRLLAEQFGEPARIDGGPLEQVSRRSADGMNGPGGANAR